MAPQRRKTTDKFVMKLPNGFSHINSQELLKNGLEDVNNSEHIPSKNNKFFKSRKSKLDDSNDLMPVIDEAMKKVLKTPSNLDLNGSLTSPKSTVKTYSNPNRKKNRIIESFCLPDEPLLPKWEDSVDFKEDLDAFHSIPALIDVGLINGTTEKKETEKNTSTKINGNMEKITPTKKFKIERRNILAENIITSPNDFPDNKRRSLRLNSSFSAHENGFEIGTGKPVLYKQVWEEKKTETGINGESTSSQIENENQVTSNSKENINKRKYNKTNHLFEKVQYKNLKQNPKAKVEELPKDVQKKSDQVVVKRKKGRPRKSREAQIIVEPNENPIILENSKVEVNQKKIIKNEQSLLMRNSTHVDGLISKNKRGRPQKKTLNQDDKAEPFNGRLVNKISKQTKPIAVHELKKSRKVPTKTSSRKEGPTLNNSEDEKDFIEEDNLFLSLINLKDVQDNIYIDDKNQHEEQKNEMKDAGIRQNLEIENCSSSPIVNPEQNQVGNGKIQDKYNPKPEEITHENNSESSNSEEASHSHNKLKEIVENDENKNSIDEPTTEFKIFEIQKPNSIINKSKKQLKRRKTVRTNFFKTKRSTHQKWIKNCKMLNPMLESSTEEVEEFSEPEENEIQESNTNNIEKCTETGKNRDENNLADEPEKAPENPEVQDIKEPGISTGTLERPPQNHEKSDFPFENNNIKSEKFLSEFKETVLYQKESSIAELEIQEITNCETQVENESNITEENGKILTTDSKNYHTPDNNLEQTNFRKLRSRSASFPRKTPERTTTYEKTFKSEPRRKPKRNSLSAFFDAFKVKRSLKYVQDNSDATNKASKEPIVAEKLEEKISHERRSRGRSRSVCRNLLSGDKLKIEDDTVSKKKDIRKRSFSCRRSKSYCIKDSVFAELNYEIGQVVWAKLGKFPYWPSIITSDPESGEFKQIKPNKSSPYYHIRFFGDQGRRAWANQILPFENPDDLEKISDKLVEEGKMSLNQIRDIFGMRTCYYQKWQTAIDEAENLKTKSVPEKLQYFDDVLRDSHKIKIERKKVKKENDANDSTAEEPKLDQPKELIEGNLTNLVEKSDNLRYSRRIEREKIKKENAANDSTSVKLETEDSNSSDDKSAIPIERANSRLRKRKNDESSSPKLAKKRKITASPELDLAGELAELQLPEFPNAITSSPTTTKTSEDPPPKLKEEKFSLLSQLPDFKKNLFRGVKREKVCRICEKPGKVLKCHGQCYGDFHPHCAEIFYKNIQNPHQDQKEKIQMITEGNSGDIPVTKSEINSVSLNDQIDEKMKEIMGNIEEVPYELNESSEDEIDIDSRNQTIFKHVTADDELVAEIKTDSKKNGSLVLKIDDSELVKNYKCPFCTNLVTPPCFLCNSTCSRKGNAEPLHCSSKKCGRYYHVDCLKHWPQTQWSAVGSSKETDSFVCPRHVCHTCLSENLGSSMGRTSSDKLVKCVKCPATYHNSHYCVPAGTEIVTALQIICPRHNQKKKHSTSNTPWCFVCSRGGKLICCETCPTSVHLECLPVNLTEDGSYICEDCESGRFPLHDEVVWVKCGSFRWWPAVIVFPNEIPSNLETKPHGKSEFVVRFYGTHDYYWVGRGRTFLYQEGDTGCLNSSRNRIDEAFNRALNEAAEAYLLKKETKVKKDIELNNGLKPPPYIQIKNNRPVGNVRKFEGNLSNATSCECDPDDENPCGPNSNCINRLLMTECTPELCPAGERCNNQKFEKREYPRLIPCRTKGRGWGLKTLESLEKGQFVIEYVGEMIDEDEYRRRIARMHQQKDENYYFLTIDTYRMLDAGPKGNVARFMNHSCNPNCETQKWTVNGDTRVGIFAIEDIPAETELTFNYNLECIGTDKKPCMCGAPNCSGFIGVKPDDQKNALIKLNNRKKKKVKKKMVKQKNNSEKDICFICKEEGELKECCSNFCIRTFHLQCLSNDTQNEDEWFCPSHFCNNCSRKTSIFCAKCTNSFCSSCSDRNIRYNERFGFLCNEHDKTIVNPSKKQVLETENDEEPIENISTLRSERYKRRCSGTNPNENSAKKLKL